MKKVHTKLFLLVSPLCSLLTSPELSQFHSVAVAEEANPSIHSLLLGSTNPGITPTLSTKLTLLADPTVSPTAKELVTFGLPVKENLLTDTKEIRVTINYSCHYPNKREEING